MNYTPTRVYVKLEPNVSRALGRETEKRGSNDPRKVATSLIREALGFSPLCPACTGPTFKKDGVHYCESCNMKVAVA